MFKDYYKILNIPQNSTKQQIKNAYRNLALKWHPDKNPEVNVTRIMQDINEAYKILYDDNSRKLYDEEYSQFMKIDISSIKEDSYYSWDYNYEVHNEDLKESIKEARIYAKNLVEDFLKNLKKTADVAAKGAWDSMASYIVSYIIAGLILSLLFALIHICN